MQSTGKKRRVLTCIPCYNRKQKCNRRYPCNQCTRGRRVEECVYTSSIAAPSPNALPLVSLGVEDGLSSEISRESRAQDDIQDAPSSAEHESEEDSHVQCSTMLESFRYYEDSNSNTIALLKMLHSNGIGGTSAGVKSKIPGIMETVQQDLERMPSRQVLDFLVQYFVSDLNCTTFSARYCNRMKQIVHASSFLTNYEKWWLEDKPLSVANIEFAVLILRICLYATQFLPSPSHTIDTIRGVSLHEIRSVCSQVGDSLAKSCGALDWKGSLVRVQHLLFAAIKSSCQGRTDKFWEGIASASQAAQKAGIHRDFVDLEKQNGCELEKEMRRRVFCSLYVLDSYLFRQLDRVPFLQENLVAEALPRMHLVPNNEDIDVDCGAPDMFTERLMQVKLARFWNRFGSKRNSQYDPTQAEARYEEFCAIYLPSIHPALALAPQTDWDSRFPKVPMQRHLLHICIFDSICWNFRPLLLLKPYQIICLAPYKQVLLQSQKKLLAAVALKELETISALHSMFNDCHTRFGVIIFNTFEASVILLALCTTNSDFLIGQDDNLGQILGLETGQLTRRRLMQAAEKGLNRLQFPAEVSEMAASGARTLAHLFANAPKNIEAGSTMGFDDLDFSTLFDHLDSHLVTEPFSGLTTEEQFSSAHSSSLDFLSSYDMSNT